MKIKILLSLMLLVIAFSGCQFWGVRGSGDFESEERKIDKFTAIEASRAFMINVRVGAEQSVMINADDNLLKYIITKVRGGKLIIDSKRELNSRKDIVINITVEELNSFEASGASDILIEGIDNEKFEISLSGACDIKLQGNTDKLYIDLSGAGNVQARDLIAKDVRIGISGAADATVYASESLDAEVSGVGSVDYYGNPEKVSSEVSGVGSIKRK